MIINPAAGGSELLQPAIFPGNTGRIATSETSEASKASSEPARAVSQADPAAKPAQGSPEQVADAVKQIEQFTQAVAQNLKFSIDEDTGKTVVKIMDSQTNEMIRQIPSEEAINIARTLGKIEGLLFNDQA